MANAVITYILWLIGGWFGLHHFYLGRDRQAFVWWSTLGGCFGLGWLRDLVVLPRYIFDANNHEGFLIKLNIQSKVNPSPPFSVWRFGGEIFVGFVFCTLVRCAPPEEYMTRGLGLLLSFLLPPIAGAIGVHLVANIGREEATLKWPLLGSCVGIPWLFIDPQNTIYCPLISAVFVNWKGKKWRLGRRENKNFCKRLIVLFLCGFLYLSLWTSCIYFNTHITDKDGESVPVRVAVQNFFKSKAWEDTKETMKELYNFYKVHGFKRIWEQLLEAFDPSGEANAYRVLGLGEDATQKEISKRYKELAKEWHPDKHSMDPESKAKAHEKFMEIQQAYEILSNIKNRRARKHMHEEF